MSATRKREATSHRRPRRGNVAELLAAAGKLPAGERRRLLKRLEASFSEDKACHTRARRSYSALLALSGTAHTNFPDVSENKERHLGEIYADDHR